MSLWSKRREEDEAPKPAAAKPTPVAPNPAEAKKETTPVSSVTNTPFKSTETEAPRGSASIGKAVKVNGQIYSKEDLYVDGDVEGTIELLEHKLTIGPNGKVHSAIRAREVVVLGSIQGNVEASDRLEIRKDAKLVGDIKTARIIIEDGAFFKGSIDIVKPEAKPAPPPPRPQPQPAAAVPATSASAAPASAAEVKR